MQIEHTVECLLKLRSVRDQFDDAGLALSSDKLAEQLAVLENSLLDQLVAQREHRDGVGLLTVAVVGDFNSGKSTFINALLDKELCPVGEEPTTASVTHFIHGDKERIEQQLPDGERKPIAKSKYRSLVRHDKKEDKEPYIFHIYVDSPILEHIRLVDTPGFNAPPPNTQDTRVTENALTEADALFVLIDTRKGNPTKSLLEQLERLQQTKEDDSCPPMFLLLNKAEDLPPTQRTAVKDVCQTQYRNRFRDVMLISALQLNNSEDAVPLDALQAATQQVRDAIMRREPFDARISARVVTSTRSGIYRMDINGNVYEAPVSSARSLASWEQLCEMVQLVSAERHGLFEKQLQRKTSQLREDWQRMLSSLDDKLKLALGEQTGVNGDADDIKSKALEAIDSAKFDIFDLADEICEETFDGMITKSQRKEEKFFSDSTFYRINVHLGKPYKRATESNYWDRISNRYNLLLSSLKRLTGIGVEPFQLVEKIKKGVHELIRELQESYSMSFAQYEYWDFDSKRECWQVEYSDDGTDRDEHYSRLSSEISEVKSRLLLFCTQAIQEEIDRLKEAVISNAEQNRAHIQEEAEELELLQQRIDELKEYTP